MRKALSLATVAIAFVVAAPLALAAPPPTMTGETLLACSPNLSLFTGGCSATETKGSVSTIRNCPLADPITPGPGTFTFQASGLATGVYPGTFTESGSATLAGLDLGLGLQPILEFTASFTIDSPAGHIEGTKRLSVSEGGICDTVPPFYAGIAFLTASYTATITTPAGKYRDEGTAETVVYDASTGQASNPQVYFGLGEAFASTLTETVPALPTTKDECKNGGWQTFGVFKNQGECVSFVSNGGKKPPAVP
ncbi:MAG: hypothetical protein QOK32_849 [Gaiellaceae bacterium]|jgi:hypothetical protein|nr:hypothetical protein [Gaiellaceae bacterium]MDX6510026.1 hypothetical protein [Gaiellaceae bacterium]MDX6543246.1 hypothetical protein [Gaiellaceae bacterium]